MPVTVSWYVPRGVVFRVLTVIVDVPEAVTEAGVKVTVAPAGSPAAESETTPEKPPWDDTVTV